MDVTEQEQLTQELRRREAYLAEAQRLSHTGSFGWKPDTGEIVWSDETYCIFEYDSSVKPTIDSAMHRVHPQDRADFQKVIADASQGATDFEHTYRLLLPDGRVKHVHALAHALQDASGNREFVGAVTDITERKTAEEALRTSEAYLAEAQRLSHTGSWSWSPDTDTRYWSEECYRVLGFDPRDGAPRMEELIQRIHPDDQLAFRESANRGKHKKLDEEVDYRIVHPGGAVRDIHSIGHPVLSPRGDLIEYTGTVIDITERKRAEEDLRASERKYRHLVDTTPAFIHTALPDGSLDFLSRGWLEYGGLPETNFLDWRWTEAIHPEDVEGFADKWRTALASGEPFEAESRVRRADGEYRWFLQRNVPLRDESGNIVKWYGTGIDIEERKAAEESLRSSEAYLAEAQRLTHTGSWAFDPVTGKIVYWSEEMFRIYRMDPRRGLPTYDEVARLLHPEDSDRINEAFRNAIRDKAEMVLDYRHVIADGTVTYLHTIGHPVLDKTGALVEYVGTLVDVTESRRAEQRLLAQYRVTRILADAATVAEATPKILQALCECLGWDLGAVWRIDPNAGVLRCAELWRTSSVEAAQFEVVTRKSTFRSGSGLPGRVWETGAPAYIPDVGHDEAFRRAAIAFPILLGCEVSGVIGFISRDVSQPDQELLVVLANIGSQIGEFAKRTAAVDELQLRVNMLHHIPVAAWSLTPDGTVDIVNQLWLEYSGHTPEYLNSHPEGWMVTLHPEDRERASRIRREGIRSGRGFTTEARLLRASDGTYRWHLNRAVAVRDPEGNILRFVGTSTDVHDLRQTQEALRNTQTEFAHMTRVMTMGELTASIAHEVNQPLGAMVTSAAACARWLATKPPQMDKAKRALERIASDGKRAAEVIRRIRALMKRQAPRKEWLDINEAILEVIALAQYQLRRSDILVETRLANDLPLIRCDRVQLQQVLLNLIINAIEAMSGIKERPRELTIASASDGPDTVSIEVRDTGTGLDPEHAPHLFEPFYTTKAEGLGIGLSISRSILEAHGGRLSAAANAPHGTVFSFSVPVNEQAP